MNNASIIRRNRNGGLYAVGKEFTEIKWMEIAEIYEKVMDENDGKCSIRKLAVEARIDKTSAHKSILFYAVGMIPYFRRCKSYARCNISSRCNIILSKMRLIQI